MNPGSTMNNDQDILLAQSDPWADAMAPAPESNPTTGAPPTDPWSTGSGASAD